MEPYRLHVLSKMTGGRPQVELAYIDSLFGLCGQGAKSVSGPAAVAFFKRSKLPVATLREIWPLASVYKGTALSKEEFLVFTAYIMFVQGS